MLELFIKDLTNKYSIIQEDTIKGNTEEINKFGEYIFANKSSINDLDDNIKKDLAKLLNLYLYSVETKPNNIAIKISELILKLDEENNNYQINHGNLLKKNNRIKEALIIYKKVVEKEDNYNALHSISDYYIERRNYVKAKKFLKRTLTCIPSHEKDNIPVLLNDLSTLYYGVGNYNKYLLYSYNSLIFKISLDNKINIVGGNMLLIKELDIIHKIIVDLLEKYEEYTPLYLLINSLLPEYYETIKDINEYRNKLTEYLNLLINCKDLSIIEKNINLTILEKVKIGLPLSYHNMNNVKINTLIGQFYKKIFKKYFVISKYVVNKKEKKEGDKIKVGFISSNFYNHSVGKDRRGVINKMDRSIYEVYVFSDKKPFDYMSNYIAESCDKYIVFDKDLEKAQKVIADCELDILIFADLGMDIKTYCIALGRLAPIQVATWGHSDTSGLPTIDYFVSSKYFEIEDAQMNYSERLIQMDSLSTYYFNIKNFISIPEFDNKKTRLDLNLPLNLNMYLAPHTLFKNHESFDELIKQILDKDPFGFVVFISGNKPHIKKQFLEKLNNKLGKLINQVYFVPHQKLLSNFLKLIKSSDVIIDSFPFGGCNVSFEAFSLGKLVITKPSDFINGRFTYGFYKKMDILEPIAYTNDEYVDKSVYYANNKEERQKLEKLILEKNNLIFETQDTIDEWNKILKI
jgi:predicted O-linked N-acetylglucosamine transferase (SPINDLY family)